MDNGNLTETDHDYAVTGKIMLIAIVVLFIVIIFMLCLHVQIRRYLRRQEQLRRNRNRNIRPPPPHFVFYMDSSAPPELTLPISRGLNASVISSLPVFNFSTSSKIHTQVVECAVCLSEFEDGETGRVLPKCNHSFHIDCIDMWFHSHSTCPLCRAPVEPLIVQQTRPELTVSVCQTELVSDGKQPQLGVTGRSESFGGVSGCESPSSFRSQMSRVLSFTRILSRDRERKGSFSPSSSSSGCIVAVGSDSERVGV